MRERAGPELRAGRGGGARSSSDHHSFLARQSPLDYLHHASWRVHESTTSGAARAPCSRAARGGTCRACGVNRRDATSPGTSRILLATSRNTSPTWIACLRVKSGDPKSSKAPRPLSTEGSHLPRPSSIRDLAGLMTGAHGTASRVAGQAKGVPRGVSQSMIGGSNAMTFPAPQDVSLVVATIGSDEKLGFLEAPDPLIAVVVGVVNSA
jgi:hypothetical protein